MDWELSHVVLLDFFGLHTEHKSFKYSINSTEWKLKKLLLFIFKIFHESSSTLADYEKFTKFIIGLASSILILNMDRKRERFKK